MRCSSSRYRSITLNAWLRCESGRKTADSFGISGGTIAAVRTLPAIERAIFGLFAALLAAAGILAAVSYAVSRRTHEIGVRIALGAAPRGIIMLVMRDVAPAIAVGLAAGFVAIYNLSSLLTREGLLFEVREHDVPTYAAAAAMVIVIAGVAAWVPARRAAQVDPIVALRTELRM